MDDATKQLWKETLVTSTKMKYLLESMGWKSQNGNWIKQYQTAVAPKTAILYGIQATTMLVLTADYQSEGRNVLSTQRLEVTTKTTSYALSSFLLEIDKAVDDSYARRLYLLGSK